MSNSKKQILISFTFFAIFPLFAFSQASIENLFGHKGSEFSIIYETEFGGWSNLWYYADLDIDFSYDSLTDIEFDYFHTLSYELIKGAGLTIGNSFNNNDFLPHIGMYWTFENKSTDISIFPLFVYSLKDKIYGLNTEIYFEKYFTKGKMWYPYSLIIINGGYYNDGYWETSLNGYLGVSYLKKLQFGFGSSLMYTSEADSRYINLGLFISYSFE